MNNLFTKSSSEAKLTDEDIKIFARVCEKGINEFTQKNTQFTDTFELESEMQFQYGLKKFRSIKDLEPNQFCKAAVSDKYYVAIQLVKNKAFMKCYQSDKLVMEIAMSKAQLEAIEDKYYYDIERFTDNVPRNRYQVFYAGSYMRKQDCDYISTKLTDLRLLKIVNLLDVKGKK